MHGGRNCVPGGLFGRLLRWSVGLAVVFGINAGASRCDRELECHFGAVAAQVRLLTTPVDPHDPLAAALIRFPAAPIGCADTFDAITRHRTHLNLTASNVVHLSQCDSARVYSKTDAVLCYFTFTVTAFQLLMFWVLHEKNKADPTDDVP